jgi:hypothetical protein
MIIKADIEIKQVENPTDNWCESGHHAPLEWRRGGPDSCLEPTTFWHIKGKGVNKVICEPCLMIVNYLKMKKGKTNE